MKILYIVNSFENGAIPNILLDIAPELEKLGGKLSFLALEPLPEDHQSVKRCRGAGYPLTSLNLNSKVSLGGLFQLKKAIRTEAPDLIHTHLGRADIMTPWVKGKVPQVTTFHSVKRNYNRFTLLGYKVSDKRVAHRTGVSQASIDSFYADGYLHSPHSAIYNPVRLERLKASMTRAQIQGAFGWTSVADFRLLSLVGRLMPVKAHGDFITAFPKLLDQFPGLCAVIAGDGPLKNSLQGQIDALGLQNRIRLAGAWQNPADLYVNSDAVVFPSLWEGLGLVPLEAMLLKCPVAASRIPAVEEFIQDGLTGALFKPGDPEDLARVVARLLESNQGIRDSLEKNHTEFERRFSPEKIAGDYLSLYQSILGNA